VAQSIATWFVWTLCRIVAFRYGIYVLNDLEFLIVVGADLLGRLAVVAMIVRARLPDDSHVVAAVIEPRIDRRAMDASALPRLIIHPLGHAPRAVRRFTTHRSVRTESQWRRRRQKHPPARAPVMQCATTVGSFTWTTNRQWRPWPRSGPAGNSTHADSSPGRYIDRPDGSCIAGRIVFKRLSRIQSSDRPARRLLWYRWL